MTPLPLDAAVKTFFPNGGVTKNMLLLAIRRGVLGFEKIGRDHRPAQTDWPTVQARAASPHDL